MPVRRIKFLKDCKNTAFFFENNHKNEFLCPEKTHGCLHLFPYSPRPFQILCSRLDGNVKAFSSKHLIHSDDCSRCLNTQKKAKFIT